MGVDPWAGVRPHLDQLGAILRVAMKADDNASVRHVEAQTGVNYATVCLVSNGKVVPTSDDAARLAQYVLQHVPRRHAGPFAPNHQTPRTPSPARHTDPDTSHAAADSLDPFRARALHWEIMDILDRYTIGLTDEQIRANLKSGPHSYSGPQTRRNELVTAGWVVNSGEKGLMRSGRWATIWTATVEGLNALAQHRQETT